MQKKRNNNILRHLLPMLAAPARAVLAVLLVAVASVTASAQKDTSVKAERNFIKDGNKAYADGNYQKALDLYLNALEVAPSSEPALFNKALSMVMLSGGQDSTMIKQAMDIYERLGKSASDTSIKDKANYNLGNMAFNRQDYKQSIEYYKRVLRSNPSNMKARENLRVAQLKLPPEDQNENQNQQQQQNQDQQQQQQQDQQEQQQQQQQPEQQSGNADQILQSMQNRENQTRKDTEKKEMNVGAASTEKPW